MPAGPNEYVSKVSSPGERLGASVKGAGPAIVRRGGSHGGTAWVQLAPRDVTDFSALDPSLEPKPPTVHLGIMADPSSCPSCDAPVESHDDFCRRCGGALPGAPTVLFPDDGTVNDAEALSALRAELEESLAPGLQLLRPLGHGGMGTVFLARDPTLKRTVVVKVLSPAIAHDPTARERFTREAEATAAVSHPNVVTVHQVGQLSRSGTSYFVMQHVDGPTLAEEFPEGTVASQDRAKRIVGEVAAALAAAHARGLVHRDVKPKNIMLERHSDRAIVLDFGISAAFVPERRAEDAKLTAEGTSIGTPQYMSPEQAAGEAVFPRSDVYSLGLVAFELVTGRPPFQETNPMALLAAHIGQEPPTVVSLRADLEPQFGRLIERCLAKLPEARPEAAEIARALLPESRQMVEWPPPGLERFRGLGYQLLRSMELGVASGFAFFLLLALQHRLRGEAWLMASLAIALVALGLMIKTGLEASYVGKAITWALRWGYSLEVAVDLVLDRWHDTGSFLSGQGRFAFLTARERRRVLLSQRVGVASVITGISVSGVLVFL